MRPALLVWALAALATTSFAAPTDAEKAGAVLAADAVQGETPASGGEAVEYTTFNGVQVPPMKDIPGDEFAETIKQGYW